MKRALQVLLPLLLLVGVGWASHINSTRVQQAFERALNAIGQWRYLDVAEESNVPVAAEGALRLYYDSSDGSLKISTDGGAFTDLASGSQGSSQPTDLQSAFNASSDGSLVGLTPDKPLTLADSLSPSRACSWRWNPSTGFEQVCPEGPFRTILTANSPREIYSSSGTLLHKITNDGSLTGAAASGTACAVIDNVAAADDNMLLLSAKQAMTILTVWCNYQGSAPTTAAVFALEDGGGNALTHTSPTCAAPGSAATAQSITAAGTLTAREVLRFDVTNTPNPATDTYMLCVSYRFD